MKPILFNTDMVRAILDNLKTETRRIVKPQPSMPYCHEVDGEWFWTSKDSDDDMMDWWPSYETGLHPPYHPGDILYVRETWAVHYCNDWSFLQDSGVIPGCTRTKQNGGCYVYQADGHGGGATPCGTWPAPHVWRPSIHMPREAARIFLLVTDVRAERLQDITKWQAEDEGQPSCSGLTVCGGPSGCNLCEAASENSIKWFEGVWDSTVKPEDRALYGWDANPWVWVIKFERISREEAE